MMGIVPQAPNARSLMTSRLLSITELAQGARFFHYLACGKRTALPRGKYTWWVKPWNASGDGPWTAPSTFEVK